LGFYLSASLNEETDWNYRKIDQRLIVVKTKNVNIRKAAVLDVLTNLPFAINIPENIAIEELQPEKEYLVQLKVYTSKDLDGVDMEFYNFFGALDVDQGLEDFIKAYWVYPSKILFELAEFEEP
jgi:hypothetical protein